MYFRNSKINKNVDWRKAWKGNNSNKKIIKWKNKIIKWKNRSSTKHNSWFKILIEEPKIQGKRSGKKYKLQR